MPASMQVSLFKAAAIAEAISWLGLLVGMYFKYLTDAGELGVKLFGPIHGGIFIAYVLLTLLVSRTLRWSAWTTVVAVTASIPPFATVAFEAWALRSGRLGARHKADEDRTPARA